MVPLRSTKLTVTIHWYHCRGKVELHYTWLAALVPQGADTHTDWAGKAEGAWHVRFESDWSCFLSNDETTDNGHEYG